MTFPDFLKNLPSILISGKKSATKRIERKSLAPDGAIGAQCCPTAASSLPAGQLISVECGQLLRKRCALTTNHT